MKNCLCHDGNFDNCPHPNAVKTIETKGFKDEPNEQVKRCDYQLWIGSNYLVLSHFTREEYNQMLKEDTLCTYI